MQNLPENHKSALLIQSLINDLRAQLQRSRKQERFSTAQQSIVQYLVTAGPQSVSALATYRGVSAATMSVLVSSMVRNGFILRANSKSDRRSKILLATLKGKSLIANNILREVRLIELTLDTLNDEEQLHLPEVINFILKVIKGT